jgi:glucose-1-phosphate thymidylyltransferase
LTIPKPLIPVAGKPIVQRLVEDITKVCGEPVEEIAFIIGDFGEQVEKDLKGVAESLGAKGSIYYQEEALGTAHAILCAKESLDGKVVVAFADTLFKADFTLDTEPDGIIWVNRVEDPRAFGVVQLDEDKTIREFIEKPQEFVSDLAIIGIYFFKDGKNLCNELQYLIDNDIKDKGEYQLTNALENMKNKGLKFKTGKVIEWLDCGNKNATVHSNQRVLEFEKDLDKTAASAEIVDSVIIQPSMVMEGAKIKNSVVGPHVTVGKNSVIENSVISNSIIQNDATVSNANFSNSMIGNKAKYQGSSKDLSVGDFNEITD